MNLKRIISTALAIMLSVSSLPLSVFERSAHAQEAQDIKIKSIFNGAEYTIDSRFDGYNISNGVDVSKWQGEIDWEGLIDEGVEYAIIRLGYRSTNASGAMYLDNYYEQNISGANEAGMPAGVYFYSQATTVAEAKAEAQYCIDMLEGYELELPIVMDFEYAWINGGHGGRLYNAHLSEDKATEVIMAFLDTVKQAGYDGMLYANKSTLIDSMHAETIEKEYPIWLAHYTKDTDYEGEYYIWQYSDVGVCESVESDYIDCNFMFTAQVAEDIYFEQEEYIVPQGQAFEMSAQTVPMNCISEITWKTSNPAVGYFSKTTSTFMAVSPGTTTITATTDNGKVASCKVKVVRSLEHVMANELSSYTYTGTAFVPDAILYYTRETNAVTNAQAPIHVKPSKYTSKLVTLPAGASVEIMGSATVDGKSFYAVSYDNGISKTYGYISCDYVDCELETIKLIEGADYIKTYASNKNAGTATITIKPAGDNFVSSKKLYFTINPADISSAEIGAVSNQQHTGSALNPSVSVYYRGSLLTLGKDYTATYSNNTNVGTATVKITGKGNFTGSTSLKFNIVSSQLTALTGGNITVSDSSLNADGSLIEPEVTVKTADGKVLTKDTDYKLSYSLFPQKGYAIVTASGIGSYTGYLSQTFKLSGIPIDSFTATLDFENTAYTGKPIKPHVTLQDTDGNVLNEFSDYTVSYKDNTSVGTATVTITGCGKYTSSISKTFTIGNADISSATVKTEFERYDYTGGKITPAVKVMFNSTELVQGVDYDVAYSSNVNIGRGLVTITGKGIFTGSCTATFDIVPKRNIVSEVFSPADRTIGVSWTLDSSVDGYEVHYSSKESFVGGLTVKLEDNTISKTSFQSGLVIGRTYYIRVRSYKVINGTTVYGEWSEGVSFVLRPKKATISSVTVPSKRTVMAQWVADPLVSGYEVHYTSKADLSGGLTVDAPSKGMTSVSFNKGITVGRTYYVRVRSYKIIDDVKVYGEYSDALSVTIYPDKQTIASVYTPGHRAIAVTWKKDSSVTGYEVHYSSKESFEGGFVVPVEDSTTTQVAFQRGLVIGRTYYIRLRSYKVADGNTVYGEWSDPVKFKLTSQKPAINSVASPSKRLIEASWLGVDNADGYELHYSSSATSAGGIYVDTGVQTTASFQSGLVVGRTYYIRVRSYKQIGEVKYYSEWSEVVPYELLPHKAVITSVSTPSKRKITVSWEKDTTVTGYELHYCSNAAFSGGITVKVPKNTTTSLTFQSGLVVGRNYYIRVRSYRITDGKTVYGPWSDTTQYVCK